MGRFGFIPNDVKIVVSTHGYYFVKRDNKVIAEGPISDLGIRYNPYIDDLDDPRISEDADDGGWLDVANIIFPYLVARGMM